MSFLGFAPHGITLKELLENPDLQNPPQLDKNNGEGKKGENAGGIDVTSAFLGPNLWNNNYEDNDFSLEYMDLDEFLCENGIPVILDDNSNSTEKTQSNSSTKEDQSSSPQRNSPGLSIDPFIPQSQSPQSSRSSPEPTSPSAVSPLSPSSPKEVHLSLQEQYDDDDDEDDDDDDGDGEDQLEPVSKKKVNFVVESDDLALVNVPGQDNFDPRRRKFTAEELKPQPIIKKSRKVFVPDDCKDEKYWSRRRKNNVAAKRSRDARRIKENQIAMRASFLERENIAMKEELRKLKEENLSLKKTIRKYEPGACST